MIRTDHKVALAVAVMLLALAGYSLLSMPTLSQAEEAQVLRINWAEPPQLAHTRRAEVPGLIIPVEGVRHAALSDSWGAPRDGGRTHKGIDIRAEKGVPVVAAASGKIIKLFSSKRGGTTVYQADATGRFIFYYAHLDRYAAGLKVGQHVAQGDTIAYVGKTGNAPFPHLHFEIQKANPARQWWRGVAFNPYPVLVSGQFDLARASMLPKPDALSP